MTQIVFLLNRRRLAGHDWVIDFPALYLLAINIEVGWGFIFEFVCRAGSEYQKIYLMSV